MINPSISGEKREIVEEKCTLTNTCFSANDKFFGIIFQRSLHDRRRCIAVSVEVNCNTVYIVCNSFFCFCQLKNVYTLFVMENFFILIKLFNRNLKVYDGNEKYFVSFIITDFCVKYVHLNLSQSYINIYFYLIKPKWNCETLVFNT